MGDRRCLEKGVGLPDTFIPTAGSSPPQRNSATRMPKDGLGKPRKVIQRPSVSNADKIERQTIFIGYCHVALHWRIVVKISTQPAH
jgi:hypothetical protein